MVIEKTNRYLSILLLVFFAGTSLSSPVGFVLCAADGQEARIEPAHLAHTACTTDYVHRCGHADGLTLEITHHHVSCTDLPFGENLGPVKGKESLPRLPGLGTSPIPARAAGAVGAQGSEAELSILIFDPANGPSPELLRSVVLII